MFSRNCQLLTWTSLENPSNSLERALYSEIRCIQAIALYGLQILGCSVASVILADLLGNTCLLARVQNVRLLIRDWWTGVLSVLFVSCFKARCFVIYNRLDKFASQIFLIFLILVTCKNKATSASFLRQKIHSPSRFPSLLLRSLESFSADLIVTCIRRLY